MPTIFDRMSPEELAGIIARETRAAAWRIRNARMDGQATVAAIRDSGDARCQEIHELGDHEARLVFQACMTRSKK